MSAGIHAASERPGEPAHSAASRVAAIGHGAAVVLGYGVFFGWLFSGALLGGEYLVESDLYEYYLPIFLAPITTWSSYEFAGLPAFADPGDFSPYPLHALFRLVGSWAGLAVSAYVLAACFTYAYVYRLTRSPAAAAFAGLAYGLSENMIERIAHLSTLHAWAWMPIILVAIEGLQGAARRKWIGAGAIAVACCFLAGHPQPAIYTYYAALAYGLAAGVARRAPRVYYLSLAGMFALGGAIAAIKALPLAEASLYMQRQQVSFAQFAAYAVTPAQALALLFPTIAHNGREAPLYVGLATLLFAVLGAGLALRQWRARFWVIAAAFGLLVAMGDATPVARLAYELPLYDKFRVAARHLFLFAFGTAVLAGLAIAGAERRRLTTAAAWTTIGGGAAVMAAGAAAIAAWPDRFAFEPRVPLPWSLPVWNGAVWTQFAIACVTALVAVAVVRGPRPRVAVAILAALLAADLLHGAPYAMSARGLHAITMPSGLARPSVHARRLADGMRPLRQRLLAPGGTHQDAVVPAAFARVWQIPIAGGYGPMLLAHHSALAMMGTNGSVDPAILAHDDAALDLLAVKYLLVKPRDIVPPPTFERAGVTWSVPELELAIGRPDCGHAYPRTTSYALPPGAAVSSVALLAHLRCADAVAQGATVAVLEVTDSRGVIQRVPLRAGIEIADRDLAAPGFRANHEMPPPFDGPATQPNLYFSRVDLPHPADAARLTVHAAAMPGWMTIERLTVITADGRQLPQWKPALFLQDGRRWRDVERFRTSRRTDRIADEDAPGEDEYVVYENLRALPRAWMVPEVAELADDDAVHAVRFSQLPGGRRFDPLRIALVPPGTAPEVATGVPGRAAVTRVDDSRIEVAISGDGGGFLVLSETWHPGWTARIDDRRVPVQRTNVSLQGVAVPAGARTVVFELTSATLRAGAALSAIAALIALVLAAGPQRKQGQSSAV